MFVHAGVDLSFMYLDNLWSFDLAMLSEFIPDETEYQPNPVWKKHEFTGISKPKPTCKHTMTVIGKEAILIGG